MALQRFHKCKILKFEKYVKKKMRDTKMIKLDWRRYIPENHYLGADDEAESDCRFNSYNIFVLQSRLYPFIYSLFDEEIANKLNINVVTEYNKENKWMDAYVKLSLMESQNPYFEKEDKLLDIDTEKKEKIVKKIKEIQSEHIGYALIDAKELYKSLPLTFNEKIYPYSWYMSVLEYTGLDSRYNPFVRPEGIYLKFNAFSDYKTAYGEVCIYLKDKISDMYERGYIVLNNDITDISIKKLISDWELIPLDNEERVPRIFEPNWIDRRFAEDKVDFMLRKIQGDKYIRLEIPDNYAKRHFIIKGLQELGKSCIIEGNYLKVEAENYREASKIATYVHSYNCIAKGRVLCISAKRMGEVLLYFEYAEKYNKGESLSYSVSDAQNPYVFSCLLDDKNKESSVELREKFSNYAMKRLVETSKISKLRDYSPYRLIEEENV